MDVQLNATGTRDRSHPPYQLSGHNRDYDRGPGLDTLLRPAFG